jgi:hypothetical protein
MASSGVELRVEKASSWSEERVGRDPLGESLVFEDPCLQSSTGRKAWRES